MLPILPSAIFKNGKTGTPTHSLHGSHTNARAQMSYTREDVPGRLRHPSLIYHAHSKVRTFFLKSTDEG